MDYRKLVATIPIANWETLTNKLIDFILTSKSDEKMPSQLANNILHHWQNDILKTESGLTALIEAAVLLELDKTANAFIELQMANIAEQIREAMQS